MSHEYGPELLGYLQAFDQLKEAIYIVNPQTAEIVAVNDEAGRQQKLSREQLVQRTVFDQQRDIRDLAHWQLVVQAIRSDPDYVFSGRHIRADGSEFPVEVSSHVVVWDGTEYLLSSVRDITQRKAIEKTLHDLEPIMQFVLNEASDGIWDWDLTTNDVFYAPQLKRMLGYGPYEVQHTLFTWQDSLHPEDAERILVATEEYVSGKQDIYDIEYRLRTRNGDYIWVHDRGYVCARDDNGRALRVVGMVHNIDEYKKLEVRLRELATIDELTGLLNRRAGYAVFEQQLQLAIRQRTVLTIALLDLDTFKNINDQFGHQVGDRALRLASDTFRSRLRASDTLMRWGGEEFLLLMPDTSLAAGLSVCEELRQQLENASLKASGRRIPLTVSAGLAACPEHGKSIKNLVQSADKALYRAKSLGRNRIIG
ncbi:MULTISPECIES: sensor domain-containing diguanylate cyclase [Thalassolituus]|uniref:sensor domain-containing diguanylate cyclase n=1 Tax=Thalassolituus TaxID=187492 RepID=UPI001E2F861C|nr:MULTISPECIES: diguanylate cyclase [Thalassolituus]MCB2385102.1 diguanylate cyclase [Thalassolituus alkanivorans]MCB2423383.1 diguanylate cyclase [Thalassolituus alkanivorans]